MNPSDNNGSENPSSALNNFNELCCIKCRNGKSQYEDLTVVKKGMQKFLDYSTKINDSALKEYLINKQTTNGVVKIHRECQKEIYNELKRKNNITEVVQSKVPKVGTRRSVGDTFHWKEQCFLCATLCQPDKKHSNRTNFHQVTTLHFRNKILSFCTKRNDEWGMDVQRRSLDCHDFVVAEARYHKLCYERFYSGKAKGDNFSSPGRPIDHECLNYFNLVCEWLESEGEIYSLAEIHQKMSDIAGSAEYISSQKWLKNKLQQKYKEHIFFVEALGKSNVVCFRNMADFVVNDKWYSGRKENIDEESERIITTAAKLVLDGIRSSEFVIDSYPKNEEIEDCDKGKRVATTLFKNVSSGFIKYPIKQASIGQAIVNATRPRS